VFKIAVHCNKDLKTALGGAAQKLAILDPSPARLHNRSHIVAGELGCELTRNRLIEENAHPSEGLLVPIQAQRQLVPA